MNDTASPTPKNKNSFRKFSSKVSYWAGTPTAFLIAFSSVVIWAFTGPTFNYSTTWQLVINTSTTIVTFLMVFLIQNTQNRDTKATQIKLDELVWNVKGARNNLVNVEEVDDGELERLGEEFKQLREHYERKLSKIQEIKARKQK